MTGRARGSAKDATDGRRDAAASPGLRRPTLQDVAREARVSVMTASNVVNEKTDLVREETFLRVRLAIEKLGYRPQMSARALRLSRSMMVAMLIVMRKRDFLTNPWMSRLVAGLTTCLSDRGFGLLLQNHGPGELEDSVLQRLASMDGVCTILSGTDEERRSLMGRLSLLQRPVIAFQEPAPLRGMRDVAVIRQDDHGAGLAIARHVIECGARTLLFVEPDFAWPAMAERRRGFAEAIARTPGATLRVVRCSDDSFEAVEHAIGEQLRADKLPDAVLCGNESVAVAALQMLERANVRVPQDVLLTAFNAFDSWYLSGRKITTISFPAYELGEAAGERMLSRLQADAFENRSLVLPSKLLVGDTTLQATEVPSAATRKAAAKTRRGAPSGAGRR